VIDKYLGYLGISIDVEKNKIRGKETMISTTDSKVKVFVIPTNEELVISRDTSRIVKNGLKELKLWEE
jgi:acetate kinase